MRREFLFVSVPADDLAVVAELQELLIGVLESRNADLETRNGQLAGRVTELEERLARLERLLSRNSGNSGMPPSADDLPGKTVPAPKPGSSTIFTAACTIRSRTGGTTVDTAVLQPCVGMFPGTDFALRYEVTPRLAYRKSLSISGVLMLHIR